MIGYAFAFVFLYKMKSPHLICNARVLFSPLNWGMGHVGRSIPLLQQLIKQGNTVFIACNEDQKIFYRCYFDSIPFIDHAGYAFQFKHSGFSKIKFLTTLPTLVSQHLKELKEVKKWVHAHQIDFVISDQRYGFRCSSCTSVIVTHQATLPLPRTYFPLQVLNKYLLKKFDVCWIVDDASNATAGKLSKTKLKNAHFIGMLSRFKGRQIREKKDSEILLLNGPKEFHPLLLDTFLSKHPQIDTLIGDVLNPTIESMQMIRANDWTAIDKAMESAKKIYSFCGYSTKMDVFFLGCDWECIPTPGQWEQEYLYSLKTKKPQ